MMRTRKYLHLDTNSLFLTFIYYILIYCNCFVIVLTLFLVYTGYVSVGIISKGHFMTKRVIVTKESETGRNTNFHDSSTEEDMTRSQFVRKIESGNYKNYHIRTINDVKTPVSNPDKSTNNNLD